MMGGKNNIYHFQQEDLEKALEFTYKWHLDTTKQSSGRTNQGRRGFGGEIDAWVPGKLLEIGCCKIIQKFTNKKIELLPDFNIYPNKIVGDKSDPDILGVIENSQEKRDPSLCIEIKRLEENDEWLGPRGDQLESFKKSRWKDLNIYMVHASFGFDDDKSEKEHDITGSLLQRLFSDGKTWFGKFSNFDDLCCKIEFAYSFSNIKKFGRMYKKGEIIPKGSFPSANHVYNKDKTTRKNHKLVRRKVKNSKLSMKIKGEKKPGEGEIYGDWELDGLFEIFVNKSDNKLIYCIEETEMFNKYFGRHVFDKGGTYRFYLENKLGNAFAKKKSSVDNPLLDQSAEQDMQKLNRKGIDDWWFLRRRLNELIQNGDIAGTETALKEIAENI